MSKGRPKKVLGPFTDPEGPANLIYVKSHIRKTKKGEMKIDGYYRAGAW